MTDRATFEAHFGLTLRQQQQHKDGSYTDPITQARWEGWQVPAQDSARYGWLREQNAKTREGSLFYVGIDAEDGPCWIGADLDAVIDAAMDSTDD